MRPSSWLVVGNSSAGKTVFTERLLSNSDWLFEGEDFRRIIWCSPSISSVPKSIMSDRRTQFYEGLPDDDILENGDRLSTVVIIDDLGREASENDNVRLAFIRNSHHNNLTIFLLIHNVFQKSKHFREISLNANYLVYFKNIRDRSQIYTLARQLSPHNIQGIVDIYNNICQTPYAYLLFDLTQRGCELLRYRTDIFQPYYQTVFIPRSLIKERLQIVNDETFKSAPTFTYSDG